MIHEELVGLTDQSHSPHELCSQISNMAAKEFVSRPDMRGPTRMPATAPASEGMSVVD